MWQFWWGVGISGSGLQGLLGLWIKLVTGTKKVPQRVHIYYHYVMEFAPKRPFWGPNSILVVHMDPLGSRL